MDCADRPTKGLFGTISYEKPMTPAEKQVAKLTKEELVNMQTAFYSSLNILLTALNKPERAAIVAMSEVLDAFKQDQATELEVIHCFLSQLVDGRMEGMATKKEMMKELYEGMPQAQVEALWMFARRWAGVGNMKQFSHFITVKLSKQLVQEAFITWWNEQQGLAMATLGKKQQESKEERYAKLMHKARFGPGELSNDEAEWLMENSDDDGMALFDAQIARKADLASAGRLKAGQVDASEL